MKDENKEVILVARDQPRNFEERLKDFLQVNAFFTLEGEYLFGNCKIGYREKKAECSDEEERIDVALNLQSRYNTDYEERDFLRRCGIISGLFPQFTVYPNLPKLSDPLFKSEEDMRKEFTGINISELASSGLPVKLYPGRTLPRNVL
jgi:hypothetical protein